MRERTKAKEKEEKERDRNRKKYERANATEKKKEQLQNAHKLLQRKTQPRPEELALFEQSVEMALCLFHLNTGNGRFEDIDYLPRASDVPEVINDHHIPSTSDLTWIQNKSWSND